MPSEQDKNDSWLKIIGLGDHSMQKSYYPELQRELEDHTAAEQKLKAFFNCINDAVIVQDLETFQMVEVNRKFLDMFGYSAQEVETLRLQDICSTIDRELIEARNLLRETYTRGPQLIEWQARKKDGSLFWAEMNTSYTKISEKSYFLVAIRDITRRKLEQQTLDSKTEELDRFFNNSHDLLCILDHKGIFKRLNPEWERALGYSISDMTGQKYIDFVHPDDVEATLEAEKKAKNNDLSGHQNRYRHKDGSYRYLEWRSSTVGGLIYASAHDRTAEVLADEANQRIQERLRLYALSLTELIIESQYFTDNLLENLRKITAIAGKTMETSRASVWIYSDDCSTMTCVDLFEKDLDRHTVGETLNTTEFPEYTNSHRHGEVIAADDVFQDPRTSTLPAEYYHGHQIFSLLDAPVWEEGKLRAVMCFEHTGAFRHWLPEEEQIAQTLAVYVSNCLEADKRRKAENQLRDSNQTLNDIIDFIPDPTLVIDQEGRVIHWNRAMETLTGVPKSQVIGKGNYEHSLAFYDERRPMLIDMVDHPDLENEKKYLTIRREQNKIYAQATLKTKANPDEKQLWGVAACLYHQNGEKFGYIEVVKDISILKKTEDALRESETQFRAIFENAPMDIVINRLSDGQFIAVNPYFLERRHLNRSEVLEGRFSFSLDQLINHQGENIQSLFIRNGTIDNQEIEITEASGKRSVCLISVFPITLNNELCSVSILVDITEKKIVEEELQRLNDTLEQKVIERTAELQNAFSHLTETQNQLVQSERMAVIGQLTAGVAHELNTPLGAIVSSNHSLLRIIREIMPGLPRFLASLTPKESDMFENILTQSLSHPFSIDNRPEHERRQQIRAALAVQEIRDIGLYIDPILDLGMEERAFELLPLIREPHGLDLLKTLAGITSLKKLGEIIALACEKASHVVSALRSYLKQDDPGEIQPIDLKTELETILTLYHNKIKYGVKVITDYRTEKKIMGYRNSLNQVWMNLISNALQAMDYNGTLEISIEEKMPWIVVTVTDSGPGIPDAIKDKIFEPFFTTKKQGEGLGLGLDICRKIIDRMEGKIALESRPGHTSFSVWLKTASE